MFAGGGGGTNGKVGQDFVRLWFTSPGTRCQILGRRQRLLSLQNDIKWYNIIIAVSIKELITYQTDWKYKDDDVTHEQVLSISIYEIKPLQQSCDNKMLELFFFLSKNIFIS